MRVEYEAKAITVSVYDHTAKQYTHCFTHQIDLDYEGIFAISASSSTQAPQYNYVNSIKAYDQSVVSTSHHFMDSHRVKAENESWSTKVVDVVKDIIHDSATIEGEDINKKSLQELYTDISLSNYHLQKQIASTDGNLQKVQEHFIKVSEVLNGQQLYDNSVKVSTELFQTYFNISVSIAQEMMYLEQKDNEMDELLEQQVLEGNVNARDRRKKWRQGGETVVVENAETKKIRDQIALLNRAITGLKSKLKGLTAAYNDITKK